MPCYSTVGDDFDTEVGSTGEAQITVFLREGRRIFRTYATSGRVLETIGNHWTLIDLTQSGLP